MIKLHHLHLGCKDLHKSRDFYINVLRARELKHYHTSYNLEIILLELGDFVLALSPRHDDQEAFNRLGVYQLGVSVANIEQTVKELTAKGVTFKSAILSPTPGVKAIMFDAPDGVEIELMQVSPG